MAPRDTNMETAPTTIDSFVGDFESTDEKQVTIGGNAAYYPAAGVVLRISKLSADEAKVVVLSGDEPAYAPRLAVEAATYRLQDHRLIAVIELQPGKDEPPGLPPLFLTEILTMRSNREMRHTLSFSDGSLGFWICQPK
jgi:hypothetical protein